MPTGVSLLFITVASVTPERRIPRKKGILNHHKSLLQEIILFQIKIVPELSHKKIQSFHHIHQKDLLDINH